MTQMLTFDGRSYEVLHQFDEVRAIIQFDGAIVFVDRNPLGAWELSGTPARPHEQDIFRSLVPNGTSTTMFTGSGTIRHPGVTGRTPRDIFLAGKNSK